MVGCVSINYINNIKAYNCEKMTIVCEKTKELPQIDGSSLALRYMNKGKGIAFITNTIFSDCL